MRKVSPEFVDAFFAWLPGAVAGFLPFFTFLVVNDFGYDIESDSHVLEHYESGLTSHLLVMAMVASTVSVITSFSRVGSGTYPNFVKDGRGPVLILLLTIIIWALSWTLYTMQETGDPGLWMRLKAILAVITALLTSLVMEIAMSRLRLLEKQPQRAPDPPS